MLRGTVWGTLMVWLTVWVMDMVWVTGSIYIQLFHGGQV